MGSALFLSEGFHQRLHAGGEKLRARHVKISERRRSRIGGECGQRAIAQGFLREGRTQLQAARRSGREDGRGLWVRDGLQRREDGGAEYVPDRSAGKDRESLYGGKTGGTQRAGLEGSRGAEEKGVSV